MASITALGAILQGANSLSFYNMLQDIHAENTGHI